MAEMHRMDDIELDENARARACSVVRLPLIGIGKLQDSQNGFNNHLQTIPTLCFSVKMEFLPLSRRKKTLPSPTSFAVSISNPPRLLLHQNTCIPNWNHQSLDLKRKQQHLARKITACEPFLTKKSEERIASIHCMIFLKSNAKQRDASPVIIILPPIKSTYSS